MIENDIAKIIIDLALKIHSKLGPGLFESVYEEILCHELNKKGLQYSRQKPIPILWDNIKLEGGFKTDIIVNEKVLIELKSVDQIQKVHKKQVITYLKLTNLKLGLLINFNSDLIKNGVVRLVNNLNES